VAYPLVDEKSRHDCGTQFPRSRVDFRAWLEMPCTQLAKKKGRWIHEDQCQHPRHDRTREEPLQNPKNVPRRLLEAKTYLVEAGYTLAMLCQVAGIDMVMIVSIGPRENQQASGSDLTCCSNKNLSITHFFSVAYHE
jgi:hypothetical protein